MFHVTVGVALIFLEHSVVTVIHGLQAGTVRLTSMNVLIKVSAVWINFKVFVKTSTSPKKLVITARKELNATVSPVLQVL